jgi:hypothetical protein
MKSVSTLEVKEVESRTLRIWRTQKLRKKFEMERREMVELILFVNFQLLLDTKGFLSQRNFSCFDCFGFLLHSPSFYSSREQHKLVDEREFVFLKIECDVSVKWVCIWAYLILGLLRKLFFTPPLCSRWNSPHNLTICGNTTSIAFIKARSLSVKIIQQITNNISKKSQTTNS